MARLHAKFCRVLGVTCQRCRSSIGLFGEGTCFFQSSVATFSMSKPVYLTRTLFDRPEKLMTKSFSAS